MDFEFFWYIWIGILVIGAIYKFIKLKNGTYYDNDNHNSRRLHQQMHEQAHKDAHNANEMNNNTHNYM